MKIIYAYVTYKGIIYDTLKTLQNKQIVKLDKIMFDYHLNKCKNAAIEAENKKELIRIYCIIR